MNFSLFNSHTNELFADNNILKFKDIIQIEQIKLVFEFKNKNVPIQLLDIFNFNSNVHSHFTRIVANEGLRVLQIYSTNFVDKSLRCSAAITWNDFVKHHNEINNIKTIGVLKKYLKNKFLSAYKSY